MHDYAIVKSLLAAQPELKAKPVTYQPPADIAATARRFYDSVIRPPRNFYMDQTWVLHHWEWDGRRKPDGQIYISCRGRYIPVHRFIWLLNHGPVPDGLYPKPACGKDDCASIHHVRLRPRKSRSTKLTPRETNSIRQLATMENPVPALRLAEIFEVSERRIHQIIKAADV